MVQTYDRRSVDGFRKISPKAEVRHARDITVGPSFTFGLLIVGTWVTYGSRFRTALP